MSVGNHSGLAPTGGLIGRARRGVDRYGWTELTREVTTRALCPPRAPIAARKLRKAAARTRGVDALLDLAYEFDHHGIRIRPGQRRPEIRALLDAVEALRPRRMLEIGTANGGSLFLFAQMCAPAAHVISVDLPKGEFGGGYPAWKIPLYKAFARSSQSLDLIRADSHSPATLERVRALLGDEPLDFLFIDGDHEYAGVKQDFDTFGPLVRAGGLVGFHDIAFPAPGLPVDERNFSGGDVPRYWREIRTLYPSREFVDETAGGFFGIGLIEM